MSWLGNVLKFENFNLGHMWDKVKENPARLLYGGIDPASTKVWNGVLGRNDKPLVDQMGGATPDTYTAARQAGIDTGPGQTMHGIAHVIAAAYAGGYGANAAGIGGGAAAGGAEGGAPGLMGGSGGLSSADAGALFGNGGYGAGMTGAETSAFDGGGGLFGSSGGGIGNWLKLGGQLGKQFGGSQGDPQASARITAEYLRRNREQQDAQQYPGFVDMGG